MNVAIKERLSEIKRLQKEIEVIKGLQHGVLYLLKISYGQFIVSFYKATKNWLLFDVHAYEDTEAVPANRLKYLFAEFYMETITFSLTPIDKKNLPIYICWHQKTHKLQRMLG